VTAGAAALAASRPRRARLLDPIALLALPAALYFVLALAVPLARLLLGAFDDGGTPGAGQITRWLADPYNRGVVWNTLRYGAVVTVLSALGGYAYAYAMAGASPRLQLALLIAIVLPMTTSVIVKSFGWLVLLRSNGLINQALVWTGATDRPLPLLFSEAGLVIGTTAIMLPYMVLPVFSVLRQIRPELLDAAASLGASRMQRFRTVVLPLSLPGVAAGMGLVFSMTVSAYVIPSLLTGAGFKTLSKVAADAFLVILNPTRGAAVSVILLAIAVAGVALASRGLARRRATA
jgi:putative spermidine/putrescine transport system permease protein